MSELTYGAPFAPFEREDPGLRELQKLLAIRKEKNKPIASFAELARELGLKKQTLSQWPMVPHTHVLAIEALVGLPRWVARPDLYPPPTRRVSGAKKGVRPSARILRPDFRKR